MIKLFVSDMDGTVLNSKLVISDQNAKKIKELQASGIEFMIATGRTFHSAKPFLDMHGIECEMINLNGAAVYDSQGNLLQSIPIESKVTEELVEYCRNHHLRFSIMDSEDLYVNDKEDFLRRIFLYLSHTDPDLNSNAQFTPDIPYVHDIKDFVLNEARPVLKMMVMSPHPNILQDFKVNFADEATIDITSSAPDNLEITHIDAQKGLVIEDYVKAKGWTMEDVATIGDSLNDRSMLSMAKYGYVMENATDEVKALSPLRAPHHDKDGVAVIIDQILNQ